MGVIDKINRRIARASVMKPTPSRLRAPVASISFDDFPRSAFTEGGRILGERGVKGTFYAAGRHCGGFENGLEYYRSGDLERLAADGHEIGCHTFTHPDLTREGPERWDAEIARNQDFLAHELPGAMFSTFAYPYGETSPRAKLFFGRRFAACRGIASGVNHCLLDLSQLKSVGVEARHWSEAAVCAAVEAAAARTGWLIFFTHDVSSDPSPYGARPDMLEFVLDRLAEAHIDVLPVKHALARAVVL